MSDGIKHIMFYQMVNVIPRAIEAHVGPNVHFIRLIGSIYLHVRPHKVSLA